MKTNTTEIKIESGIPIPEGRGDITNILKAMKPGDSILVDGKRRGSFQSTASREKIKVVVRAQGNGKHRIWKV